MITEEELIELERHYSLLSSAEADRILSLVVEVRRLRKCYEDLRELFRISIDAEKEARK